MKKIVYFSFGEYKGERWGRTFPICCALSNNGCDVTLVTSGKWRLSHIIETFEEDGVHIVKINSILPFKLKKSIIGVLSVGFLLRVFMAAMRRFDVVLTDCAECPLSGIPANINKKIYGSTYVSEYGDHLGKGGYYDTKGWFFKMLFGRYFLWSIKYFRVIADYVMVLSMPMKQYIISNWHISEDRIFLMQGASNIEKIEYKILDKSDEIIRLGYIGANNKEIYGIVPLLKYILRNYPSKFKIILYGDKITIPEFNEFNTIVEERGYQDVVDNQSSFVDIDIFMILRSDDNISTMGWPNKLGDYVSFGRPVLIQPYGDLFQFVQKYRDGFITINMSDDFSIGNVLEKIIDGKYNLSLMGRYNREVTAKDISWDNRIKVLLDKFN